MHKQTRSNNKSKQQMRTKQTKQTRTKPRGKEQIKDEQTF